MVQTPKLRICCSRKHW